MMRINMQKKWVGGFAIVAALCFPLASGARAEDVQYSFDTPNIGEGGMSRAAKAAVESLTAVQSVIPDTMEKSLSVTFDDDQIFVRDIMTALGSVGCTVSTYKKK